MAARVLFLILGLLAIVVVGRVMRVEAKGDSPPVAKKIHTEKTLNGVTLVDDYGWLREKSNPAVIAYLNAENEYTRDVMEPTQGLQEKLYQEMVGHVKETDSSVPARRGDYFYYSRTEKGKQYRIHCRKKGSVDAPEEVMLDLNQLAQGQKFMALGGFSVSDDDNLLAYSTDNTGYRQYQLHIKDLRTGKILPDQAEKTGSFDWANDNQTVFYTVEDPAKRQYRLYKHHLGTDNKSDELVYEEKDERFEVGVAKTLNRSYMLLRSGSHTTSEYRYLKADNPGGSWQIALPRKQDIEYHLSQGGDNFFLRINDTGRNFRLVSVPVSASFDKNSWKELIPARKDTMLEYVGIFKNFIAVEERQDGLPSIRIISNADGKSTTIPMPEPLYSLSGGTNLEFDTGTLRYEYESLTTPPSTYDYDLASGQSKLMKRKDVPGYDQSLYRSERVFAIAKDGVRIPVSVVYRKDLKTAGKNPLFVTAYGSYGSSMDVDFDSNMLSLLDRGVVVALAHIRGGGDMGKPWHDDGRMMKKKNTFGDFIAATEFLTDAGYGAGDKVMISGVSAGGLLMGAVVNMRPDLFRAVVMKVPFVDVMNTMLDTTIPLTVGEFEEWGNPQEKPAFDYMYSYSPYDNLAKKAYPAILVKTSLNDSQVGYWEPAKYVAKMRTLKTDNHVLLLETNMSAGHGGSSGRYDHLRDIAFAYAFLLSQVGLNS